MRGNGKLRSVLHRAGDIVLIGTDSSDLKVEVVRSALAGGSRLSAPRSRTRITFPVSAGPAVLRARPSGTGMESQIKISSMCPTSSLAQGRSICSA